MIWKNMTAQERLDFCKAHPGCMLQTCLEWNDLSPTSQVLLKMSGIEDEPVWAMRST